MHYPTDRIVHTTAFVTPVVEHWLEQQIAESVHHEWMLYHIGTSCSILPCVCVCVPAYFLKINTKFWGLGDSKKKLLKKLNI